MKTFKESIVDILYKFSDELYDGVLLCEAKKRAKKRLKKLKKKVPSFFRSNLDYDGRSFLDHLKEHANQEE